ncbi:hypothetical protein F52700_11395 [Fusarium sp. NRRL 52700]|nr:hypothetical protein F52700_11395 [Fusarium sp. NRRL 52700]
MNTGNLRSLFKGKDECQMKDVDEVDYKAAEQDEDMALREYKIALKAWALGRMYEIHGLAVLAREHAVKLAELINPVWALVATVDSPLVMKHIPGIIHRIDDHTEAVLESTTRQQVTEVLLPQGPTLERGWRMVVQILPALVPGLTEYLLLREELRQEREHMDLEVDETFTFFNHWIPSTKAKCGIVMRAMVGSIQSSQKVATRNKEKPPKRDKYISDDFEDDRSSTSLLQA